MSPAKVLQVAAVDTTIRFLLLPLIDGLQDDGYEVHIACSPGKHLEVLREGRYRVHPIPIARRIRPFSNLRSLYRLFRLMRRERFTVVHVHTPVAAALGRVAAKLARVPVIVYTAHGFYFHELTSPRTRRVHVWAEKLLGRSCTDALLTQSAEDRATAIQESLVREDRVFWISNGVKLDSFAVSPPPGLRAELGLLPENRVVGFIGRLVSEKGVEELLEAMAEVVERVPKAALVIVGDTLTSDRDRRATERMRVALQRNHLETAVKLLGFREDIPQLLAIMDLVVLPSHREGMPRTILEAMASGKPVVATNIRGCREEVIHGVTGLLTPVRDPRALAEAIVYILGDEERASRMGEAGRRRARAEFSERAVVERQVEIYRQLLLLTPRAASE